MLGSQLGRVAAMVFFSALLAACGSTASINPATNSYGSIPQAFSETANGAGTAGLLARFSFNGTLADSGPRHLKAKDSGQPVYVTGAPFGGKALVFDGSGNAIVSVPLNITPLARPKFSMGGWFKATQQATTTYGVVSNDDGSYDRSLAIGNQNRNQAEDYWTAYVGQNAVGNIPVRPGRWVFMTITYDQSTLPGTYAFYVHHGNRMTILKGAANFDIDSISTAVTIGRDPTWDSPFAGQAANVFFYNGVLTKTQIAAIAKHGPKAIP